MKLKISIHDKNKLKEALQKGEQIVFSDGVRDLILKQARLFYEPPYDKSDPQITENAIKQYGEFINLQEFSVSPLAKREEGEYILTVHIPASGHADSEDNWYEINGKLYLFNVNQDTYGYTDRSKEELINFLEEKFSS